MLVYGKCECLVMHAYVVSCVHPVINAATCMTCSSLILVEDARRGIFQSRSHDCLVGSHECLLLFIPCRCGGCLYYL